MAHRSTMSPPTRELRHPHSVQLSLQHKVATRCRHFGLDKVKRRLIEYLVVVRLWALIAQEARVDQTKAQEVTLRKAFDVPPADDEQKEKK